MKYRNGQEVKIGDRVKLGEREQGTVVASIDNDEYGEQYPKTEWAYLKKGVLINFPRYGLIHYEKPEPDLQLLNRRKS